MASCLHLTRLIRLAEAIRYKSEITGPGRRSPAGKKEGDLERRIMKVKDVMTKNPVCAGPTTDLTKVAKMMADFDCGEIPIVQNFESMIPIGVVTDRDIVVRTLGKGVDPTTVTAMEIMTTPVITVSPETELARAERLMEDKQIRRIIAVDHVGRCCGILATADIARYGTKQELGEVMKEISSPSTAGIYA